jgi:cytoskeletal protein RodZ
VTENKNTETLGEYLRKQRQKMGFSAEDLMREKRISIEVIEALESGQYHLLPGDAYIRGYLRSYAQFLNLEFEELVARYKFETQQGHNDSEVALIDLRESNELDHKKKGNVFLISLIVGLLVLAAVVNGLLNKNESEKPVKAIQALQPDTLFTLPSANVDTAKDDTDLVSLPNPSDTLLSSIALISSSSVLKASSAAKAVQKEILVFEATQFDVSLATKNSLGVVKNYKIIKGQKVEVEFRGVGWMEVNEMRGLKVKSAGKEVSLPGMKFKVRDGEILRK